MWERLTADDIYVAKAPRYIICPSSATVGKDQEAILKRIEGCHKVVNGHLKHWKCLSTHFVGKGTPEEKMEKHNNIFCACAVVKQVLMKMGIGKLYKIGDDDYF